MAQVAFWSPNVNQNGSTSIAAAVASVMALEHEYNNLILSTSFMDESLESCFFNISKIKNRSSVDFTDVGLDALERLIRSKKISIENLTDYTNPILKERLDLLFSSQKDSTITYDKIMKLVPGVLHYAESIYDIIFLDVVNGMKDEVQNNLLKNADLIVVNVNQSMHKLEEFFNGIMDIELLKEKKFLLVIGRYDRYSKFNAENLIKKFKYGGKIFTLPYNTQFFDMQNDHRTLDFFIKYLNVKPSDRNGFFVNEIKILSEEILKNIVISTGE